MVEQQTTHGKKPLTWAPASGVYTDTTRAPVHMFSRCQYPNFFIYINIIKTINNIMTANGNTQVGNIILNSQTASVAPLTIVGSSTLPSSIASGAFAYDASNTLYFNNSSSAGTNTAVGTVYVGYPRGYTSQTVTSGTAYQVSTTHDCFVIVNFSIATNASNTTATLGISNASAGTYVNIATASTVAGGLSTGNVTVGQSFNFICPKTYYFKFTGSGATIISAYYLPL